VSLALLAASAIVIAGAVACIAGRGAIVVALGAAAMLAATGLVADPLPAPLLIVERVIGAALAAQLLLVGLRGRPPVAAASALPWPAVALLAAAAFAVGAGVLGAFPSDGAADVASADSAGVPAALGGALALVVVAITGAARRSDGVQRALLALPLVAAAGLFEAALFGEPSALDALIGAGLGVAVAGLVAVLASPIVEPPSGAVQVAPEDDEVDDLPARRSVGRTDGAHRSGAAGLDGAPAPSFAPEPFAAAEAAAPAVLPDARRRPAR